MFKKLFRNIQDKEVLRRAKLEILDLLPLVNLIDLCDYYGVAKPKDHYFDMTKRRVEREVSRKDYINVIIKELSLGQLEKYKDAITK